MAFADATISVGPEPTPVSPLAPGVEWRFVGDYWTFAVSYMKSSGAPAVMTGQTAKADLILGNGIQVIPTSVLAPVAGDAPNFIRFGIDTNPQHFGGVQVIPQNILASSYPVRLRIYLTDGFGRDTTYRLVGIAPLDPKTVDVKTLPQQSTIVAVAGPAGPTGETGIAASAQQIADAVNDAIPGVVISTLENQGLPNSGPNLDDLIDSRVRAILASFQNTGELIGSIQGGSTLVANLSNQIVDQLAGSVQSQSSLSGYVISYSPTLSGAISGVSSIYGAVFQTVALAGSVNGFSSVSGVVTQQYLLAGIVQTSPTIVGNITNLPVSSNLAGMVQGQSSLGGVIMQSVAVTGSVSGQSRLTGALFQSIMMAGAVSGQSSVRGTASQSIALAGTVSDGSTLTGQVTRAYGFVGQVGGGSTLTGSISVSAIASRNPLMNFLLAA